MIRRRRLGRARIVNLHLLTYAGNPKNLEPIQDDQDYVFAQGDVGDRKLVGHILDEHKPQKEMDTAEVLGLVLATLFCLGGTGNREPIRGVWKDQQF